MYSEEAKTWKALMDNVDQSNPAFEVYKKNWMAAVEAMEEAQSEMLSKTEEWAEAMRAVLENKLAKMG
jgi:hypothetical protein